MLMFESKESFIRNQVKAPEIDQTWEFKCNRGKKDKKRL